MSSLKWFWDSYCHYLSTLVAKDMFIKANFATYRKNGRKMNLEILTTHIENQAAGMQEVCNKPI